MYFKEINYIINLVQVNELYLFIYLFIFYNY